MPTATETPHLTGTITFLMTDVEGSTTYWESHPAEMAVALARHDELIERAAADHNGHVVRPRGEGDSRFLVFPEAVDAVRAAIAIQRSLAQELSWLPFPLKVRAGLHTGTAEWRDGDYYGTVVNRCARIRGLGHGGQTLLSETTASLVRDVLGDDVSLVNLGTHRLRGLPQPERVYQVTVRDLPSDFPPLLSAPAFVQNLPAMTAPLIGRHREAVEIVQLFTEEQTRLVTLTGQGGMGKTRLAVAVGEALLAHFRDGVCFVNLAALLQPEAIGPALATALNYQAPDQTEPLLPQLLSSLKQRHLLLIFDNFEHILGGVPLVDEILRACPRVAVLATSREALNLVGETRYRLSGLDFPTWYAPETAPTSAAVQLFVSNGRRVQPHFDLTPDNVADVMRICQLVQGVPLGLVLAASWLELLTPAEIADEVEAGLDFLAADLADLPPRQRSMEAVFQGSWQMLAPAEQVVLAKLSVFRGGFTREAADVVANASLRVLLSLVNKSLLQRQADSDRFGMHELLRQFTAAKYAQEQLLTDAALAHCHYFAGLVLADIRQALYFYPLQMPRQRAADRDNFYQAWAYAIEHRLGEALSDMARGMVLFSLVQGTLPTALPDEAIRVLRQSGMSEDTPPMRHLHLVALAAQDGIEDHYRLKERFLAFLPAVETQGSPDLRYWTYERLALIYLDLRDPQSIDWTMKVCRAAEEMEDQTWVEVAAVVHHWNRLLFREFDESTGSQLREHLAHFERPPFQASFAFYAANIALGIYYRIMGDHELAIPHLQRALDIGKGWQDLFWIGLALGELAHTYEQMNRPDDVRAQELDAFEWHVAIGQTWQMLGYLWSIAVERPELLPDRREALALLSMVYHHPEATAYHCQKIGDALPLFETEIEPETFAETWEQGKSLAYEAAIARVRAALGSAESTARHAPAAE